MRTTIVLEDELLQEAKAEAVEQKLTLSQYIANALRRVLAERATFKAQPPFVMPTYGGVPNLEHEPSDFKEALEEGDLDRYRQ